LAGNLQRVIPQGLVAEVDRGTWTPAPVFAMIAQRGRVTREEMEKTFNMGVGMIAVVAPEDTDRALAILTARHLDCWVLGTVCKGGKEGPRVRLVGQHPRF
ncbi:MAG TPA: AIR synthase-related protein, partial [Mycobacterium sp.]|nr:AIR synthase-related protein [Mycobacterium sp.]